MSFLPAVISRGMPLAAGQARRVKSFEDVSKMCFEADAACGTAIGVGAPFSNGVPKGTPLGRRAAVSRYSPFQNCHTGVELWQGQNDARLATRRER